MHANELEARSVRGPKMHAVQPHIGRHTWAIVLAGGHGRRLLPLVRDILGEERPKQFAPLIGSRSLLRQTLDRVELAIPAERTVIVSLEAHLRHVAAELRDDARPTVLLQPEERDTAAGVLLPVHWIKALDPDAVVAIFPSDHFVREESAFARHVAGAIEFVERHPGWLLMVGARPTGPDVEYGWIERGEVLEPTLFGDVSRAASFVEKPTSGLAGTCFERGWLWNTFILVASVDTLIDLERRYLPELSGPLGAVTAFVGTRAERWAIREAYRLLPSRNFSRTILQSAAPRAAVSTLSGVTWSDVGTPARLLEILDELAIPAPWMRRPLAAVHAEARGSSSRRPFLQAHDREVEAAS
jgi:mannose-1-phosphate guanylyltransferase